MWLWKYFNRHEVLTSDAVQCDEDAAAVEKGDEVKGDEEPEQDWGGRECHRMLSTDTSRKRIPLV
jgi:hypothetical protein